MKKFLKKNKIKVIIGAALLIFLILVIITIHSLFFSTKSDKYGNRLDGINKVQIKDSVINKIKKSLKENEKIDDVEYHLEGRLVNFIITVNTDEDKEGIMNETSKILENLSDKIKSYYDIQVIIDNKDKSENYPVLGYKHKTKDGFTWNN